LNHLFEQLKEGDMVSNFGVATSLRNPKPFHVELQRSWCAVESETFGGACFLSTFGTFKFVVAVKNISVFERTKYLGNGDGPVHLK